MESTGGKKGCQGCQKIQEIVVTNEQMIHEQIKLIKDLHAENTAFRTNQEEITDLNVQLRQQVDRLLSRVSSTRDWGQQTDNWFSEELGYSVGDNELRVSTKVNIKAVEESASRGGTSINKENLHQLLPISTIRKDEEYFNRKRKNSFEEEHNATYWLKIIEVKGHRLLSPKIR